MYLVSHTGINWNRSGRVLSKTGINWNDMYVVGHIGINWSDLGVMTKIGVNWYDMNVLTYRYQLERSGSDEQGRG